MSKKPRKDPVTITVDELIEKTIESKNCYYAGTSQPTNNRKQSTGPHTTRAPTEQHFGTDITIRSKIPLSK